MKITSKSLMVNFETEVVLGNNNSIEMTLIHQAFIYENEDGSYDADLDLSMDIANVKFLGIEIEEGYKAYQEFKAQLLKLGIDINKLIDEKEAQMHEEGIKEKLIERFNGTF